MVYRYNLKTSESGVYNITTTVKECVYKNKFQEGICVVYTPNTHTSILISDHAHKDFISKIDSLEKSLSSKDFITTLTKFDIASVKSSVVGVSQTVIVSRNGLMLGGSQGIYFIEFNGPTNRNFYIKLY